MEFVYVEATRIQAQNQYKIVFGNSPRLTAQQGWSVIPEIKPFSWWLMEPKICKFRRSELAF